MVANGQQPVTYGYDAASRLTQVAQGALAVGLGYDNANRRISLTYPNGTSASYTYDAASRLTNINHIGPSGIIEALTYAYDPAGNRTSLTRNNGTASLLPNAVASASYDAANEQIAFSGAALTYDSNGNLTGDGTNTYVWDARNRLTQISGGVSGAFSYDALSRRTAKTITGVGNQFVYDGRNIASEVSGNAASANYLRSLNIDEPFIRQAGTEKEHYHADALGSTLTLTNDSAGTAAMYSYEPFGKTAMTGSSASPSQYTGRENDGTGLHYYRARYFNPRLQRFISEDPIGFLGGDANFFVYVRNAPLGARDPLGLWTPEFHKRVTRNAALTCGMSDADADALSGAVYDVDFLLTWPIPSFSTLNPWSAKHVMPGTNWRGYATGQLNAAKSGGGLSALGRGIHALQDAHSHDLVGSGMWDHMNGGHDPDDPRAPENEIHATAARNDTITAIRGYMYSRGMKPKCAEAG